MGLFTKKKKVTERKWAYLNGASSWYDRYKAGKFNPKKRLSGEIAFSKGIVQGKSKKNTNLDTMSQLIKGANNMHEMPYTHRKLPGLSASLGTFTEGEFSKEKYLVENTDIAEVITEPEMGNKDLYNEYVLSVLVQEYSLDTKTAILDNYLCQFNGSPFNMTIIEDKYPLDPPTTTGRIFAYNVATNSTEIKGMVYKPNTTVTIKYGVHTATTTAIGNEFSYKIPKDAPILKDDYVEVSFRELTPPATWNTVKYRTKPAIERRAIGTIFTISNLEKYNYEPSNGVKEVFRKKLLKQLAEKFNIDPYDPELELVEADMVFSPIEKRNPNPDEMKDMTPEEKEEYLKDIEEDNKLYKYKEGYKQYRIYGVYTWKGHTGKQTIAGVEQDGPIMETPEIIDYIPSQQAKYDELTDLVDYYFMEVRTKDGHRKIVPIKDFTQFSTQKGKIALATARIPIWQNYGKYWGLTLEQTGRKNRPYRRSPKPKKGDDGKKLYEKFKSMDMGKASVDYIDVYQCFNLVPYLREDTRHHRAYQKYAEVFSRYFDKVFKCYGTDTFITKHISVDVPDQGTGVYRFKCLKTIVESSKVEQPHTFIGSHPATGSDLILYTYVPNYSNEEDQFGKRKVLNYTLYCLDLTYWYGKAFTATQPKAHKLPENMKLDPEANHYESDSGYTDKQKLDAFESGLATSKMVIEGQIDLYQQQYRKAGYSKHEEFVSQFTKYDLSGIFKTSGTYSEDFKKVLNTPTDGFSFVTHPIGEGLYYFIHNRFGEEYPMVTSFISVDPDYGNSYWGSSFTSTIPTAYTDDTTHITKVRDYNASQFTEARKSKTIKWANNGTELTETEKDNLENTFKNASITTTRIRVTNYRRNRNKYVSRVTDWDANNALRYRPITIIKTHEVAIDPKKLVISSKGLIIDDPNFPKDYAEDTLWIRQVNYRYASAYDLDHHQPPQIGYTTIYEGITVYHMFIPKANEQIFRSWYDDKTFNSSAEAKVSTTPRLPLKLWYHTPVYVQSAIASSTFFYAIKYHYTIKKANWFAKIIGPILIVVGIVITAASFGTLWWVGVPLMSAGMVLTGAVYGIPWLQFLGMIVGIVYSVVAPFYAPIASTATGAVTTMAAAYGTSVAVAISIASLAMGAYSIATFFKDQKAIREAKQAAKDKENDSYREEAEARERFAKELEKIDLANFDINTSYEEQMDMFYWICYGGLLYDPRSHEMLNYNTALAKSDYSQYDRFK